MVDFVTCILLIIQCNISYIMSFFMEPLFIYCLIYASSAVRRKKWIFTCAFSFDISYCFKETP